MKKFLALLFVCAGLTAMAAAPHVNNTAKITKQATHAQVMQAANSFDKAQVAKVTTNSLSPKTFFKQYGMTPNDNKLLKKAPRRVDAGSYGSGTHVDFHYIYTFGEDGYLTQADPYYVGGNGVYFQVFDDTMYCAGIYWNPWTGSTYYLPIYFDFNNMTFEIEVGYGLDNKSTTGSYKYYNATNAAKLPFNNGAGYYRIDTVMKTYLVNENYFYSEEGDGYDEPVGGNIYEDASLEFNEEVGYAFFGNLIQTVMYRRTQNGSQSTLGADTTSLIEIHRGTQFITANATHEYKYQGSNASATTYTNNVYAYQYDDTTAVVFGLFGMGMPGNYMFIYEPEEGVDYNMYMPAQMVYDDEGYDFLNSTFELDANHGFQFDEDGYVDGFLGIGTVGDACNEYIHWDATVLMDTTTGSLFYPLFDNYLRLNDDIWYLGNCEAPTIQVTPGDEAYTFAGITEETGSEVFLFVVELDEEGQITAYEMVTNPYSVTRTDVDQIVSLAAIANGAPGKNPSEIVIQQFTVPKLEPVGPVWERGDVNMDGEVDINDVTRLIDVVLGKDVEFDENAADCNTEVGDDSIDINDVTALINRVLTGAW